jgi:hypothetical protein
MASDSGNTALAVGFGVGGGLLLWYVLSGHKRGDTPSQAATTSMPNSAPATAAPTPTSKPAATTAPAASASTTSGACALRLDASGLTADGARIDIPGAVARCKVSGRADLIFASDGPAQVYLDLNRALAGAGVAVTVKVP